MMILTLQLLSELTAPGPTPEMLFGPGGLNTGAGVDHRSWVWGNWGQFAVHPPAIQTAHGVNNFPPRRIRIQVCDLQLQPDCPV